MHPLIPYFEPFKIPISGDFGIHGFGILVAIGFIVAAQVGMRKARRDGLDADLINRVVAWLVVGVFVGGHLGHLLLYYPEDLIDNPMVVFQVWHGLSSFGGFIACGLLAFVFFKREASRRRVENRRRKEAGEALLPPIYIWGYADVILYAFTIGWFWGRMGCFSAHDHAGTETGFWLGVYGMCPTNSGHPDIGIACHDLGLYEGLFSLALYGAFVLLDRKPRFPGLFIGLLFAIYGPVRFVLDIFRHPATDTRYFGFTPAQYGSVLLLLGGAWILASQRKNPPLRPVVGEGKAAGD